MYCMVCGSSFNQCDGYDVGISPWSRKQPACRGRRRLAYTASWLMRPDVSHICLAVDTGDGGSCRFCSSSICFTGTVCTHYLSTKSLLHCAAVALVLLQLLLLLHLLSALLLLSGCISTITVTHMRAHTHATSQHGVFYPVCQMLCVTVHIWPLHLLLVFFKLVFIIFIIPTIMYYNL